MTEPLLLPSIIQENLEKTYARAHRIPLTDTSRFIVFSDFHLGSGKRRDEFRKNAELVTLVLREWYLPRGYALILNGDIEEMHRWNLPVISRCYEELSELFLEFHRGPGLYKIQGNHDSGPGFFFKAGRSAAEIEVNSHIIHSLVLEHEKGEMLVLHGHQTAPYSTPFRHSLVHFSLRYLAHPLHINNIKRDFLSDKPLKAEQKLFEFAKRKGIIALAGHTHRALFEGNSEEEYLKIRIDRMIRDYMEQDHKNPVLKEAIGETAKILEKLLEKEDYKSRGSIYDPLSLSCLFNSGTVIHRFGATGIEIKDGRIFLNAWFDRTRSHSRVFPDDRENPLKKHPWIQKYSLKSDDLNYLFTRLRLLTDKKYRKD